MTSIKVFRNYYWPALTGVFHTFIFILTKPFFKGVGGKLGAMGMLATLLTTLVIKISDWEGYSYPLYNWDKYNDLSFLYIYIPSATIGCMLTYLLRVKCKKRV